MRHGLLSFLSCWLLVSCAEERASQPLTEKSPAAPEPGVPEVTLSPVPSLSGNRFDVALQPEMALVDPSSDGWASEVLADRLLKTLKTFGAWAENEKQGECPIIFTDSFRGSLPKLSDTPLAIDPFRISRNQGEEIGDRTAWLAGWPAGLESHFKVIQIASPTDKALKAAILVDHVGEALQENSVWTTTWQVAGEELILESVKIPFFERVEQTDPGSSLFADATGSVIGKEAAFRDQFAYGIDHWRERIDWRFGMEVTGPHGLAIGDVNGDGRDDVYVCETGGLPNRLFVQQADGSAKDIAAEAGLDFIEPSHSALLVDWDNDGDQDLALTAGRHIFFYENDGAAQFQQKAVVQSNSMARSMAAADYDSDGDVDLYVCGYYNRSGDSVGLGRPMPYHDANNGVQNLLLANTSNWQFENVTEAVGLDQNNTRFSYAAVWEDADNDGDPDLYVANDFGRNNFYRNDSGRFTDIAAKVGIEDLSAGMSVSWGDYNQDGLMDLYVGNMFSSAGNRVAYQRQYRSKLNPSAHQAFRRHARGNTLFENRGDGTFRDVTLPARVNMGRWSWSSNFVDVNNDSHEDLLVANGMVTSDDDTGDL
jgi:hypothetical protein